LASGADIVVATPGRLLDHLQSRVIDLSETETFVLDEADQMLDLGFLPAIRKVLSALPKTRQNVLLSATMPKPIRALAHDMLRDPAQISVARVSRPAERIEQRIEFVERTDKRAVLTKLLKGASIERAIVFTRTKRGADRVCRHLTQEGLRASAIHGDKTQGQRERALEGFRKGRTPILVATDIAARGIDVDGISHVINFELPNVPEVYVHRIGRTARAGSSGIAVSLCDREERAFLRDIERLIGQPLASAPNGGSEKPRKPRTQAAKPVAQSAKPATQDAKPAARPGPARKPRAQSNKGRPSGGARNGGNPLKRRKRTNSNSGGSPRPAQRAGAASAI
jgi:ATP-dependent RNA helicase RhlE